MSVYKCENCGNMASTLAGCPGCGAVVGNIEQSGIATGITRRMIPPALGLFGLCLTVPAGINAVGAYNVRVAENQAKSDSLRRLESDRQHAEERRIMVARADSILNTIPRSRIAKLTSDQLNSDLVIVRSRSDPFARRWIKTATKELDARFAKTKRRSAGK